VSDTGKPVRADFQFWWSETVRWGDMDAMNHVNNIVYLQYLESARVGYFETRGWNTRDLGPTAQGPVVVSQTFNYRRQLHYPSALDIGVACPEIRNRSFVLTYAIFRRGTDDLIGDGSSVLAWLDYGLGKAVEIPPAVRGYLTRG
jgi:acyl-CoA thioester hydrolase